MVLNIARLVIRVEAGEIAETVMIVVIIKFWSASSIVATATKLRGDSA